MSQITSKCPECDGTIYPDKKTGELICVKCGLVLEDNTSDPAYTTGYYGLGEKDKRHHGGFETLVTPKNSRGSFIRASDINRISDRDTRADLVRQRRSHIRATHTESKERNHMIALNHLQSYRILGASNVLIQEAAKTYKRAYNEGLVRGRSIEAFVAASLYAAYRILRIPVSLPAIVKQSGRSKKEVTGSYGLLVRRKLIKVKLDKTKKEFPPILKKLNMSMAAEVECVRVLELAVKARVTAGKRPKGLAAAIIYIVGLLIGEKRTQKDIAKAAGVTDVTVRNRYRDLAETVDLGLKIVLRQQNSVIVTDD